MDAVSFSSQWGRKLKLQGLFSCIFFRVSPNPVYRLAFVIKQTTPNLSGLKLVIYNFSQFYGLFVRMASPTHLTVGRLVGFGNLSGIAQPCSVVPFTSQWACLGFPHGIPRREKVKRGPE